MRRPWLDAGLIACSCEVWKRGISVDYGVSCLAVQTPSLPRSGVCRPGCGGEESQRKKMAPAGVGHRGEGEGKHLPAEPGRLAHSRETQQDEESHFQLVSKRFRLHFSVVPPKAGQRVFAITLPRTLLYHDLPRRKGTKSQ